MQIQDRLIAALRRYCQALPDQRRGKNTTYAMTDFALAAFARFFMQSLSFLAHQRHLETGHGRSNCETLFDMSKIPRDNQIRVMLDPIEPALFYPLFADIVAELQQCGGLDAMRALDGHVLIAWDVPITIAPTPTVRVVLHLQLTRAGGLADGSSLRREQTA